MTKTYEDAISDVLAILEAYTGVGVYNVHLSPIVNRIKALNTTDPEILNIDITKEPKISREVLDDKQYIQSFEE